MPTPTRAALWSVLLAGLATAQPPDPIAAFVERIDAQLRVGFPADAPGAAVIATRGGEVVLRRAYGKASLELEVDIAPAMVFCIASVTKPLTATAVLQLVDDGVVQLDAPAATHLGDIALDRRVTVAHLLSHTSGLHDFRDIEGWRDDLHAPIAPAELCRAADGRAPKFTPGERYDYCNLNYALLARIIEVASGQPWDDFLAERVFAPAGMTRTCYGGDRRVVTGAVTGYRRDDGGWRHADPLSYSHGFGLGGLFSTVDDLAAFDLALRSGKLLKPETLARMCQPMTLASGEASGYGLGWRIDERRGHRFVHHSGGIHGWRAHIVSVPDSAVFVAVLSNREEGSSPVASARMMIALQLAELRGRR